MTRTALVMGEARGIDLATTRAFLDQGWQVAMSYITGQLLSVGGGIEAAGVGMSALRE